MGKLWTKKEDSVLRKYRPTETVQQLLKRLPGRPVYGVWQRIQKLGLRVRPGRNQYQNWTSKELTILRKYYFIEPISQLSKRLPGRPIGSIQQKIFNLGLRKLSKPRTPPELITSLMLQGKARCAKCRKIKSLSKFGKHSASKNGHQNYCSPCAKKMQLDRLKQDPAKYKKMRRNSHFQFAYQLTLEERNQKVRAQKGLCAICKKKKKLYVDHCHRTKANREMLCMKCNAGLGMFDDSVKILKSAVRYREKHR